MKTPLISLTLKLLAALLSVSVSLQATAATTRYVSTTGSDAANDCTDKSLACGTIIHAIGQSDPGDTVQVAAGTYTEAGIPVNKNLTIAGHSAADTVVQAAATQAAATDRVFNISSGTTVTISGLTITNGSENGASFPDNAGGGIFNDHATLTVNNCTVSGNSATFGGGINNGGDSSSATLTINNSTVSGNQSDGGLGGGIYDDGFSGSATLTINNSTISGNSGAGSGGGIFTNGGGSGGSATVTINNSTISGNSAVGQGGGIYVGGALTLNSTIVANNTAPTLGPDIAGFSSGDYNLVENTSGAVLDGAGTHNITGVDPMLGPLAYYGGPTPTHILLTGSPAIDQGKNFSGATTDQRGVGFPRTVDGAAANAGGGDGTDIGAFERQPNDIDPTLVVTTTADTNTNSTCDPALPCSLRDAITAANASAPDDVIDFAVTGAITLNTLGTLPSLASNMQILGPGANALTVQRDSSAASFRIFAIDSGNTVTLSGLTIRNGHATGASPPDSTGGGIYNLQATLTLARSIVTGNSADNVGGGIYNSGGNLTLVDTTVSGNDGLEGGGIDNDGSFLAGSAMLMLTSSTITGNSASGVGGGIKNTGFNNGNASLTITNSTFSGNSTGAGGGGIFNDGHTGGTAPLGLTNTTFSGNSAPNGAGGAVHNFAASVTIGSTILNAGASGANILNDSGQVTSNGYNLSSDVGVTNINGPTDSLAATGDQTNTDPLLDPNGLQDNGGPTLTIALQPGSPAIDKGKNIGSLTTDQRGPGFVRTYNSGVANATGGDGTDIGAFEVQNTPPTITGATIAREQCAASSNSQIATVNDNEDPKTSLTVTVNGGSMAAVNGVTVSNLAVDNSGNVTADVVASCSATNAAFTLRATDPGGLYAEAMLTVNVSPSSSPTLANPNFEVGPFSTNGTVTGWTVSAHVADNTQGGTTATHSAALSGGGNFQGDTLQQSFSTVSGQMYAVDFDSGIFGKRSGAPLQVRFEAVGSSGDLVNQLLTPPDANTYDPALVIFQHYHFTFTANGTSTTLRFTSVGLGNATADEEIDTVAVSLVSPSPTPTATPTPTSTPTPVPQMLNNPNFETGPFNDDHTVTGWMVTGHVGDNAEGSTTSSHSAALSSGGNSQGDILSQSFSTMNGQTYAVEFDAGIFGQRSGAALQIQVQVVGNGTRVDQTITPPDAFTFNPALVKFQHYRFTFTANSMSTTLMFISKGLGNSSADQVVDTVAVSLINPPNTTLTNGDFESGPFNTRGSVTGWTVGGHVADNMEGATSFSHAAALSEGGDSQGDTLAQTFATMSGQMYAVDFDAGIFGKRSGAPLQLRTEIIGNTTLVDQTVAPPDANTYDPGSVAFQHYHIIFMANSATTTLRFTSVGLGNASADQIVDTVSVTALP